MTHQDIIIALASPSGAGAIAVVRISGKGAIPLVAPFFRSVRDKDLSEQKSHTIHLGHIMDGERVLGRPIYNSRSYNCSCETAAVWPMRANLRSAPFLMASSI